MEQARYPLAMRALHWLLALLIIGQVSLGLYMESLSRDAPNRGQFFSFHKSLGLLILLFVAWRLFVRLRSSIPALPAAMHEWEKRSAWWSHRLLYLLMFVMPVSGYVMSAARPQGRGVEFFGLLLPDLMVKSKELSAIAGDIHGMAAWLLIGLVAIHVGAAIKHRFIDRGRNVDVLSRMI